MKGVVLFAAGLMVGIAVQIGLAQNKNVVMMNHVGINVPNIPEAITYYTQKMGYREAFRANDAQGRPTLVYLHISHNTFLELGQANAERPAGFTHYGLHVENIKVGRRDVQAAWDHRQRREQERVHQCAAREHQRSVHGPHRAGGADA